MKAWLDQVLSGKSLTRRQAYEAAQKVMDAESSPEQITALLIALRMKEETAEEFLGFVDAFRETAPQIQLDEASLLDVCGTGGDQSHTFNVSTAVALVLASSGVAIAKHGNRGVF